MLHFYTAIVPPVVECPVWHTGLIVAQLDVLESVQKRAIRTIYSDADYKTFLVIAGRGVGRN